MFIKQKGFLPFLFFVFGMLLLVIPILLFASGIYFGTQLLHLSYLTFEVVYKVLFTVIFILIFIWFSSIVIFAFPPIQVNAEGIKVKRIVGYDEFNWDEIRGIKALLWPSNARGIVITPSGRFFENLIKYYPYQIYSIFSKSNDPVILILDGYEGYEEIRKAIKTKNQFS